MRRILLMTVLFIVSVSIGCNGININENDQTSQVLVSIAVRNISCQIAIEDDPELIKTLENLYVSVKEGTISDDLLAQLSEITTDRPTLAADIGDLILLLGVRIEGESVLGISGISDELWLTIEKAWNQGQAMCK